MEQQLTSLFEKKYATEHISQHIDQHTQLFYCSYAGQPVLASTVS